MSISRPELWQRIEREGLANSAQCQQWAAEVVPSLSEIDATSGLKILQKLVELRKLTNYQAKVLAGQSSQPLRLGAWLVQQRLKDPIWSGWLVVRDRRLECSLSTSTAEVPANSVLWAMSIDASQLALLRPYSPSLPRALKLAAQSHESLQTVLQPELVSGSLLAFVAPLLGRPLSQVQADEGCAPELALNIVRQVASGLAVLHQADLAHGRVLPDRIYLQSERATLAIDPLCASTTTIDRGNGGLLGQSLGALQPAQFLAPEFHAPAQMPTPATDVYSLGCVWWWLLTGRPLVTSESIADTFRQHSQSLATLPTDIKLSEPLQLCLYHALGRNPGSRFRSAGEFLNAVDVAMSPTVVRQSVTPSETTKSTENLAHEQTRLAPTNLNQSSIAGTKPKAKRRRRSNPWLLPALAGCGFLVLLLGVLKFSGALQPAPSTANSSNQANQPANDRPQSSVIRGTPDIPPSDPREEFFQIVDSGESLLWAPPAPPAALPTDLLPPGGQLFVSFRPADLMDATKAGRRLLATFERQLTPLLERVSHTTGCGLEQIAQVTAVFHPPLKSGGTPQICLRCDLVAPRALSELKTGWQGPLASEMVGEQMLLVNAQQQAYYVTPQPLLDSQLVSQFSVGAVELMRDAAELSGAPGPLLLQLEKLWNSTDRRADLSVFGSAPFLLTEGRGLFNYGPTGIGEQLTQLLGGEMRGFGLQMRLEPQWYVETRFMGANDQEAGKVLARQEQWLRSLPPAVESQLESSTPHPHWRALALRFPQMLRSLVEHTRFGVEHGTAIMNSYLPSEAANNILLASWLALQPGANLVANATVTSDTAAAQMTPLGIEAYLSRSIRLSFDQEPIETALQLVADEANDKLPAGTTALRFELDGDAFEKAGITRNQQLRNFKIEGGSVRAALTEIAKRGNPVTTVTDTRQDEQKLIWLVKPDPENAGREMISLTTRASAQAAGIALPLEFGN